MVRGRHTDLRRLVLISYKIWQVQQEVDRYSPSAMRPNGSRIILTVIESGRQFDPAALCAAHGTAPLAAIYSALLIILIVTSIVGTPATLAMLDLVRNALALCASASFVF